jgi:hypothetical protein
LHQNIAYSPTPEALTISLICQRPTSKDPRASLFWFTAFAEAKEDKLKRERRKKGRVPDRAGKLPLPPLSLVMMQVQQAWDHPVNLEHLRLELDVRTVELRKQLINYHAEGVTTDLVVPQGQELQLPPGQFPPQFVPPSSGSVPLISLKRRSCFK